MNLPSLAVSRSLRRLVVVAGVIALSTPIFACGDDDDDDDDAQAGTGGESGAGKGGSSGKSGSGGKSGSSGKGGSGGKGGTGGAMEEDGGMLDDAGEEPGPDSSAFRNVTFHMSGLTIEIGQFMQFRLISQTGDLITVGVIHSVPLATFDFELPHAAPAGEPVTVEVWADTADPPPPSPNAYDSGMDHAWTATIPAGDADEDASINIVGGIQASPPILTEGTPAGSLSFRVADTGVHYDKAFELRVIDHDTGRLVGRQLLPVAGGQIGLEVFGVIHAGVEYQVDYAIDANDNHLYNPPPADLAWRQFVTGSDSGYMSGSDAGVDDVGATISLAELPPAPYVDVGF